MSTSAIPRIWPRGCGVLYCYRICTVPLVSDGLECIRGLWVWGMCSFYDFSFSLSQAIINTSKIRRGRFSHFLVFCWSPSKNRQIDGLLVLTGLVIENRITWSRPQSSSFLQCAALESGVLYSQVPLKPPRRLYASTDLTSDLCSFQPLRYVHSTQSSAFTREAAQSRFKLNLTNTIGCPALPSRVKVVRQGVWMCHCSCFDLNLGLVVQLYCLAILQCR